MNESPESIKERKAQQRVGFKRQIYRVLYVLLFISLFPILWYSFLLTAIHQALSLFVLIMNIEYRSRRTGPSKSRYNISSIFLIVFHLLLMATSIFIFFFAKENPQTGNYYF